MAKSRDSQLSDLLISICANSVDISASSFTTPSYIKDGKKYGGAKPDYTFFGMVSLALDKKFSKEIPTACVMRPKDSESITLMFGEEFWDSLDFLGRVAVIVHELLHVSLMHLWMHDDMPEDRVRGLAVDLSVNQFIPKEFFKSSIHPPVYPEMFPDLKLPYGLGALEYYKLLRDAAQDYDDKGTSGDAQFDKEMASQPKDWHKYLEGLSEEERARAKAEMEGIIKETLEKDRGNLPQDLAEAIKMALQIKPPKVSWQKMLKQFTASIKVPQGKKTRRRENFRFKENKGTVKRVKSKLAFVIDESGSMSDKEVMEANNELYHVYKQGVEVDIVHFSVGISLIEKYTGSINFQRVSCGGTEVSPVLEELEKKDYNGIIVVTDSFVENNITRIHKPILWLITQPAPARVNYPNARQININ